MRIDNPIISTVNKIVGSKRDPKLFYDSHQNVLQIYEFVLIKQFYFENFLQLFYIYFQIKRQELS